jgi:hypothetical protein
MTNEDIIRIAREAGFDDFFARDLALERFATLVAAAEREACALIAITTPDPDDEYISVRSAIAAAIRARGHGGAA